jgi:hypothetical protein
MEGCQFACERFEEWMSHSCTSTMRQRQQPSRFQRPLENRRDFRSRDFRRRDFAGLRDCKSKFGSGLHLEILPEAVGGQTQRHVEETEAPATSQMRPA